MSDKNQKTVQAYNNNPQFYADKFDSYRVEVEDIDRCFRLNESGLNKVLELGCGSGRDAEYIISKVRKDNYTGLDASAGLIEIAKNKVPHETLHVKDMREVDFPADSFGIIFSFASVLHLKHEELADLINKSHKWLKSGGILFISSKYGPYHEERSVNLGDEKFYYFYTPEEIQAMIPYKFFMAYKNVQDIREQSWFEVALRKI